MHADTARSAGPGLRAVPDPEPVLEIRDLAISYVTRAGEIPAVADFDLTIRAGESVALVGESGCGKSTVANAIMRYMGRNGRIAAGSMRFKGRDMLAMSEEELRTIRGNEIAMVYQEPFAALNPSLTVGRQLAEVSTVHHGLSEAEARAKAAEILADVRLADPDRILAAYPHQLSGGQQQRVVIAMALLANPSLLLLDEPTTALDVTVEAGIVELIGEIKRKFGTAILFISHNLGLVREVCDRVAVMYSGEVVEEGAVEDVFTAMRHPYTRGLFGCIPVPAADKHARPLTAIRGTLPLPHERPRGCNFGPRCDLFRDGLCDAGPVPMRDASDRDGAAGSSHRARCLRLDAIDPVSRPHGAAGPHAGAPVGEVVLEVAEMQKHYPVFDRSILAMLEGRSVRWVKANEALSFEARRGQTVAIVGESGCGKSTFARVLMGLETATDGAIRFEGDDIAGSPVTGRPKQQVANLQMIFQNPNDTLNPSQTVGGQIARVIEKFGVESEKARIWARVYELLDLVKLPRDFARRMPRQLSGGQKQRIGIARAFAGNPSVVVADEPLSALDVSVQAAVTQLLMDIQRDNDTTLLFISHDLSLVRYLADRVVVMYLGRIMEQGRTADVFEPPYHPYTEALLSAVPVADPSIEKTKIVLEGALPSPLDPPAGCPFATRCPRKLGPICDETLPPEHVRADGHRIACHIPLPELEAVEPVFREAPTPMTAA
ncbi:ABC transporter ATP-binding protein [Salinarimonas rosea]|uniref:ABC transporter ATP-binding protein n=1 Tax=Salinarimonas rosea TaxID=552063 RepID=UPI000693A2E9|nr:ABC transporter ATP-binding protein [Salinarimonas rosea]